MTKTEIKQAAAAALMGAHAVAEILARLRFNDTLTDVHGISIEREYNAIYNAKKDLNSMIYELEKLTYDKCNNR